MKIVIVAAEETETVVCPFCENEQPGEFSYCPACGAFLEGIGKEEQ